MTIEELKRRFTVEEYHRMGEAGILAAGDRVELIEGEILRMTPIGRRHAACVDRLAHLFSVRLQGLAQVRVQNPVLLGDHSEPVPDVALLRPRADFYAGGHPRPEDILLLVEVADSTLEEDRRTKIPLYARSGVGEAWIVDLGDRAVEVYRRPEGSRYRDLLKLSGSDSLALEFVGDCRLAVDELLT